MSFMLVSLAHSQSYDVIFNVDMDDADPFNPATDDVYISGSMAGWPMPGSNSDLQMQPQSPGSMIYTITLNLNAGDYEYKYFRVINNTPSWDHGEWQGSLNRDVEVFANMTINDIWGLLSTDPVIAWANLQWPPNGDIFAGNSFDVYAQLYIPGQTGQSTPAPGVQAWIGYHTADTDPSTWNTWIVADYNEASGNNDEYMADIGVNINTPGTYYYASRFKLNDDDFVYGGYSDDGGSFWDGVDYVSGILTVTEVIPDPEITWANLQWPPDGTIITGNPYDVFAQVFVPGHSGQGVPVDGVNCWIGFSTSNTDPQTWNNWVLAAFNESSGNNDEYFAEIGTVVPGTGTYYYASRFQLNSEPYVYGGYSDSGGGFWDGVDNVSGILVVEEEQDPEISWANLEYPPSGYISISFPFDVYAQVYIADSTGQGTPVAGVQAWIGYGVENTDPSTWSNWVEAGYNLAVGNNDEYIADIGSGISTPGTYYYASRFQFNDDPFVYGGYSDEGGGFWDGTNYISGVLNVEDAPVYILDISISPPGTGTASGGGLYPEGVQVEVLASAEPGYVFVNWTENGNVVSTSNPYVFNMPAENLYLTANFEPVPTPVVIFNVDMTDADPFNPSSDDVYISGTLNDWAEPGTDSAFLMLPDEVGSMIYTVTIELEPDVYNYKYFRVINGIPGFENGEWPEDIYREIIVQNDTTADDEWGVYPNVGMIELHSDVFTIYPNPAVKDLFLTTDNAVANIVAINFINLQGQVIKTIIPAPFAYPVFIDTGNMDRGIYMLEILTTETRAMKKVILL